MDEPIKQTNPADPVNAATTPASEEGAPGDQNKAENPENAQEEAAPQFVWGDGLSLEVSSEQMSATMELSLDYADNYNAGDLLRYLEENNITFGVLEHEVNAIFEKKNFNKRIKVAKGRQPQHGKDGCIDWRIDLSILEGARLVERGGRVDHKERHHVIDVSEGQVLAALVDPTEGEPGMDVYGKEIPANPGKEAKLPAGKNVAVSEDGREMSSQIKGVICKEGEKVSVSPVYNVQGDVNYSTGNVRFDETIVVSGGILPDFIVEAGQDIHVTGLIESAKLTAKGSIYCTAGVQGGEKAELHADGDIRAKFVNAATLVAGGHIVIEGAVTQSNLKAGGSIVLESQKGVALGGVFEAEKMVVAEVFGSDIGAKTNVILAANISNASAQKHEEERKLQSLMQNYNKIRQAAAALNKLRDAGKITEEQNALRMKITRTGLQLQGQIKKIQDGIKRMDEEFEIKRKQVKGVIARDVAWPGVNIEIMGHKYAVKTRTSKAQFVLKGGEIQAYGYNPDDDKKDAKKTAKKETESGSEEKKG